MGLNYNVGRKIADLRRKRGLSQKEFAELMKISVTTLSRIECESEKPSINMILKIASFFDINVDRLIDDSLIFIENHILPEDENSVRGKFYSELKHASIGQKIYILDILKYYTKNIKKV